MAETIYENNTDRIGNKSKATLNFQPRLRFTGTQTSFILGAYFYGYFAFNFVGCIFIHLFGPKKVMIICLMGATLFIFILPPISYASKGVYGLIIISRILVGSFCGPLYSAIHELLARWAPVEERTTLAVLTHSGNIFGLILTFLTGALSDINSEAWEYYIFFGGCLGIFSLATWIVFVYDYPWEHPSISEEERQYIMKSLYPNGIPPKESLSDIPLKALFTSIPLYATSIAHMGNNFILYMFLTGCPKYLREVYYLSPKNASLISIIPFFINFLFQFVASYFTKYIRLRFPKISITNIRKIDGAIGFFFAFIFMIPAGFTGPNGLTGSVFLLSMSMGFIAFNQPGFFTGMIDLSPRHASFLMGISNTVASISGFVSPTMIAKLKEIYFLVDGYKYSFIATASVTLLCGTIWLAFGSSELQNWSKPISSLSVSKKKDKEEETSIVIEVQTEKQDFDISISPIISKE